MPPWDQMASLEQLLQEMEELESFGARSLGDYYFGDDFDAFIDSLPTQDSARQVRPLPSGLFWVFCLPCMML